MPCTSVVPDVVCRDRSIRAGKTARVGTRVEAVPHDAGGLPARNAGTVCFRRVAYRDATVVKGLAPRETPRVSGRGGR